MSINLSSLHVLLVEDLSPLRDLVMGVLKAQGVGTVSFASDGQKGYEQYLREHPDMIITDWNMPSTTGVDLVKKIRCNIASHDRTLPIIMTTGFCSPSKITQARDAGVTEFLIKPFSAKDMAKRIQHVIKSPRDFVVADSFCGPDRRRKESPYSEYTGVQTRRSAKGSAKQIIKPNFVLQSKLGLGSIDELSIAASQRVIDDNRFNFLPLAEQFIAEFEAELAKAGDARSSNIGRRTIDNIALPIMQLKANARIFKFSLLGDIATVLLSFLDNLNILDTDALDVLHAHQNAFRRIVSDELTGNGGAVGGSFRDELEKACLRYMRTRADMLKKRMQTELLSNSSA